jgi:hypothetical protein
MGLHFLLLSDVDLANTDLFVIGHQGTWFRGSFDGNGRDIYNFKKELSYGEKIGFFDSISVEGLVENIRLINCDVSCLDGEDIGILAGYNQGTILNCYVSGTIGSNCNSTGGLVGKNTGRVSNCQTVVNATGDYMTGGLIGRNSGVVTNCCAIGDVRGGNNTGGFMGYNWYGETRNSYAAGDVSGTTNVGGLIGRNYHGSYSSCFWDVNTCSVVNGIGNGSDLNVIGKTTAEMQMETTYALAGWDFTTPIWKMNCEGMSYPKLNWWEPVLGDFGCPDGVELIDFSILASAWYTDPNQLNWNPICDISDPNDNIIDERDLGVFVDNYLEGI